MKPAQGMGDTGSGMGNRIETGGSRRNCSMHGLITQLTSCLMGISVRDKGKEMFQVCGFFYLITKLQSHWRSEAGL